MPDASAAYLAEAPSEPLYGIDPDTADAQKTIETFGLMDAIKRGLAVRAAGLSIYGLIIPQDWNSFDYEARLREQFAANGSNQFVLRSDKMDTIGYAV